MMNAPAVTPAQYGAGGLFAAVALACITTGVEGSDLLAYLASSAIVTVALIVADAMIRRGRAGIEANRALVEPPVDPNVSVNVEGA